MKTYHKCVLCDKPIIGGDVVINQRNGKDFAHQICVTQKRIKDTPKSTTYFNLFERVKK